VRDGKETWVVQGSVTKGA